MLKVVPSIEDLTKSIQKTLESCSLCNKRLRGKVALKIHLQRTHNISENMVDSNKQYFCPFENCCHSVNNGMPFSSFAGIKQHYKLVHGTERFTCSRCERYFKTKHSCKQHEVECGVKYLCSCNVQYTTKRGLIQHIKTQNHMIPDSLKPLFEKKKKIPSLKIKPSEPKNKKPSGKFILPKTWKRSVKLFQIKNLPMQAQTSQHELAKYVQSNVINPNMTSTTHSVSVQFPPPVANTSFMDANYTSNKTCERSEASTSWMHKNISIQTESNLDNVDWLNIHDDVDEILFENIATQTNDCGPPANGPTDTDSAMCQTDWCDDLLANNSTAFYQNNNNNYSMAQSPLVCDAQNQTIRYEGNALPGGNLQPIAIQQPDVYQTFTNLECEDKLPNFCTNIETQTDQNMNYSTAETQTVHQILLSNNSNPSLPASNVEISQLDAFLNNIETQTDMLLSPWPDNQMVNFVNSYTQTPDTDFLSQILNLET